MKHVKEANRAGESESGLYAATDDDDDLLADLFAKEDGTPEADDGADALTEAGDADARLTDLLGGDDKAKLAQVSTHSNEALAFFTEAGAAAAGSETEAESEPRHAASFVGGASGRHGTSPLRGDTTAESLEA